MRSLLLCLALLAPTLTIGCTQAVASPSESSSEDALTSMTTSQKKAIASAVEADVRKHAHDHLVTTEQDALDAVTDDADAQAAIKRAIIAGMPEGASAPYYGSVTVSDSAYLWVDVETDEGEGPTAAGTTFVYNAAAHKVLSRDWIGSHQY